MTPEPGQGFTVVDATSGARITPRVFGTWQAAQGHVEGLPGAAAACAAVVECDPLPVGPEVPWASSVLVEEPADDGEPFTCEAVWQAAPETGLPSVEVQARFSLVGDSWSPLAPAAVVMSSLDDVTVILTPWQTARMADMLSEAAQVLARALAGESA